MATQTSTFDLQQHYDERLVRVWRRMPFVLRITEWREMPVPVLVVKERHSANGTNTSSASQKPTSAAVPQQTLSLLTPDTQGRSSQGNLVERGHLAGEAQRRCLPVLRLLVGRVRDEYGIPLELQRYLTREGLALRVNLPLDEEAGAKLGLIFRLQERLTDLDRVELIARRVARFTREEALYWLSRTTSFEPDANRWAVAGLRLMLGGQAHDPAVERMLQRLREAT
jgi:hypothetical protein